MSEQLTLEGLLSQRPAGKSAMKATDQLDARIDALIEAKSLNSIQILKEPVYVDEPPALIEAQAPEPEILTVSGLNRSIKTLLERSFNFLWVKGEISNFKVPGSGHIYFTLKDSGAQIRAIMFRGFAQSLKFQPKDGMEVVVRGRVTVYEPRGDYQLFCEVMEPIGFGALQIAFEQLKTKLQQEGLFEQGRKRALPKFPTRIAIVTSPTGAAIRDMLNILSRRFGGGLEITVVPTSVQGDRAPGEIARAVELVSRLGVARFDVLIVGRGGGSLEDLWAFNTEEVARAVSRSMVPTISAVGHEVDFTICDFVADLRAPTPSAAAELVVKNKADLSDRITLLERHALQQMHKRLQLAHFRTDGLSKRLIDPKRKLQDLMLRCDEWSERLSQALQRFLKDQTQQIKILFDRLDYPFSRNLTRKQNEFSRWTSLLNGLSPLAVLERGYSIVKKDEKIVKSKSQVVSGDRVQIRFGDGEVSSRIL